MSITTLAPWFGSDSLIVDRIGAALDGCEWVGIPFSGGASAVLAIKARTIVCNDLHRHIINLCRCVADPQSKDWLVHHLGEVLFHPDVLAIAQENCRVAPGSDGPDPLAALSYFICVWMVRSSSAGTPQEFTGSLALRWNAGGGDSNVRFRAAIDALETFHRAMADRCTFSTIDAFEFLDKCHDLPKHGLYVDPPFIGPGLKYTHNPGRANEVEWHRKLAARLNQFTAARVVVRAYDVRLIRELYDGWEFRELVGRTQTNGAAQELLIVRRKA